MTDRKENPTTNCSNSSNDIKDFKIDKVYRKNELFNTDFAAEFTGGVRYVSVSLPRVRWLEKDSDCQYTKLKEEELPENKRRAISSVLRAGRRSKFDKRGRTPAPKWTEEEDKLVLRLKGQGLLFEEIAIKCGRSRKAIMQRLRKLDQESKSKTSKRRK